MFDNILKKIMKKYKVIKYSKKMDGSNDSSNSNKRYVVLTKKEMIDNMNINILFAKADIIKFKGERYNFDDIIRQRTSSKKKEKPEGFMTCDEKIYYNIIPKKEKLIKRIEVILKKSAVDYYLYNSLSRTPIVSSEVKFSSNGMTNIGTNRDNGKKEGNRCPKKRRPVNGSCASKYILAKNKYDNDCCYKKKKI